MTSEAQKQATKNYLSKLKTWTIRIKPEEAEQIEQAAAEAGQSKNEYVLESVRSRMEQSDKKTGGVFEKSLPSSEVQSPSSCQLSLSKAQIETLEKALVPIIESVPPEQRSELKEALTAWISDAVDKHKNPVCLNRITTLL